MIFLLSKQNGCRTITNSLAIAALVSFITAMALPSTARAECSPTSTQGIIGGIAGAALGGFLGSKIGDGSGQTIATIGGALAGGFLGNQAATRLTCEDQQSLYTTTQHGLEDYPTGRSASWTNPDSGNYGTITPMRTYQNTNGHNCREFEQTIYIDGRPETGVGHACRQRDGTWRIVDR